MKIKIVKSFFTLATICFLLLGSMTSEGVASAADSKITSEKYNISININLPTTWEVEDKEGNMTVNQICEITNVSRASLYRKLSEENQ